MRPYLLFILACACALAGALGALAQEPPPDPTPTTTTSQEEPDLVERELQKIIDRYRHKVWHWQRVMGRRLTRTLPNPPPDLADRVPVWRRVATRTWSHARHPPHAAAWRCIQHFEAGWRDSGAPYYGGLQMDLGFQQTYGRYLLRKKGTAEHWTPLEQMWVAERALRADRGFYPWPNTARFCGLL
ncbi:MAG TPA: hypothetical protein VF882_00005 [Gemmatimonadales bacterium]